MTTHGLRMALLATLLLTTCQPARADTCSGAYPSYFQDPAFESSGMWADQVVINRPPPDWSGPVFRLSDAFASAVPEKRYPWSGIDPFEKGLPRDERERRARAYIDAVMAYIQEGNIESGDVATDWALCNNPVRKWFHIPYQTYEPLSGREFVHGLTREAPVTMTLDGRYDLETTMWAVGFYNPAAGKSLASVWTGKPDPRIPSENFAFDDGSVIGKLLFTTATPQQYPFLRNMPAWQANISAPEFCVCTGTDGKPCTYTQQTEQCPRTVSTVYLLQFDIAVRDARSPIGWAYGTFVADGERRASEKNPWKRISPLGLMWGNDTPPVGQGAIAYPPDPRKNGLQDGAIFWDAVDMLNARTNAGHLGCNSRLNGPADNAQSSCLSCHQTASVPDSKNATPPILYQFGPGHDPDLEQCAAQPSPEDMAIDQVYFQTLGCSESFTGPPGIVSPPAYASGAKEWISTDFSLQLSISLTQWQEWQQDRKARSQTQKPQGFDGILPGR